jgi:flagellar hook-length control protein FliK
MEIGGLGLLNSLTGTHAVQEKSGKLGSFAGMMEEVLSGTVSTDNQVPLQISGDLQGMTDLLAFLKSMDLLDLEDGGKLLEDLISNSENLLEKALLHFGITNEELQTVISNWSNLTDSPIAESDEDSPIAESNEKDILEVLSGLFAGIANLPLKDLASKLNLNDKSVMKALKLFELMAKYADGNDLNHSGLKESLKTLSMNLEEYTSQNSDSAQTKYLQNRFTRLAAELNLLNSKNSNVTEFIGINESSTVAKNEAAAGAITFLPQFSRAEQLTLMLNEQGKPVSPEQLMKQFESILAKSQFINSGGTQKLFIKLFPEHLGSIRVELFQKDQVMMARIITSTGTAKETLESQVNGLKQAFAAQSISVEKIEIFQQTPQQERFLNRDPNQQQQHKEPQRQQHEDENEKGDFSLSFEEALLSTEI